MVKCVNIVQHPALDADIIMESSIIHDGAEPPDCHRPAAVMGRD